MKDLLLKFADRQAAIDYGVNWGATDSETEQTTPYLPPGISIYVIGDYTYNSGDDDNFIPTTASGWWVMIRADDSIPTPDTLESLVVERNENDPTIPNVVWA